MKKTLEFFNTAKPEFSERDVSTQIGVHIEEFDEMLNSLGVYQYGEIRSRLNGLADDYKRGYSNIRHIDKKELLDSLCDQIVTAIGVAKGHGMDIIGAFNEVENSNLSKFYYIGDKELDYSTIQELNDICSEIIRDTRYKGVYWGRLGEYVVFYDENGKIMKNPRTYFEPKLDKYLGEE